MADSDHHKNDVLSRREIQELLEPIRDHGHCWGFIAEQIIKDELERRKKKRLGPYGDWPKEGH